MLLAPKGESEQFRFRRNDNFLEFLGPGGFATPDDNEALELCQEGFLNNKEVEWNDISKGMIREQPESNDEEQMRAFWRQWDKVMSKKEVGRVTCMNITRQEVEDLLFHEAELLDEWKLKEWAALFSSDGRYLIPPIGNPEANTNTSLYLVHDDRARLEQRALRLLKKEAHVEYPHSTTLHNVSNVRIIQHEEDVVSVKCNFATYRTKREMLDCYVGVNEYKLVNENGELKIKEKKVVLKLDSLSPHGKVSIIL